MPETRSGDRRKEIGRVGEDIACRFLEENGFDIVERNYRTRYGEIDIVVCCGDLTVFVEVKTRRSTDFGEPEEAVTPVKLRRIRSVASDYLQKEGISTEVRFDVISVSLNGQGNPREIRHIPGVS